MSDMFNNYTAEAKTHFEQDMKNRKFVYKPFMSLFLNELRSGKRFIVESVNNSLGINFNTIGSLMLPYPVIVIEHELTADDDAIHFDSITKYVITAIQVDKNTIDVKGGYRNDLTNVWTPSPAFYRMYITDELGANGLPLIHYKTTHIGGGLFQIGDFKKSALAFRGSICTPVSYLLHLMANEDYYVEELQIDNNREKSSAQETKLEDVYHVVRLLSDKKYTKNPLGGHHASPREHERRGFWRKSKLGKRHWVPCSKVNSGTGGIVSKDYIVDNVDSTGVLVTTSTTTADLPEPKTAILEEHFVQINNHLDAILKQMKNGHSLEDIECNFVRLQLNKLLEIRKADIDNTPVSISQIEQGVRWRLTSPRISQIRNRPFKEN